MSPPHRTLITVCTYNEIENLPDLIDSIFEHAADVDLLVVDDNSPDGTGRWVDQRAREDDRVRCIHRAGKLGLGSATIEAFRHAIQQRYDYVLNLDADFSHDPKYIPALIAGMDEQRKPRVDVMIGSRYVKGGGIEGWPLRRKIMSRCVNFYARVLLGLKPQDCSGSFRCYRIERLKDLELGAMRSTGYSYLEEILWRLKKVGAELDELPIVFIDRQQGRSKISTREAVLALWIIFRLGIFGG